MTLQEAKQAIQEGKKVYHPSWVTLLFAYQSATEYGNVVRVRSYFDHYATSLQTFFTNEPETGWEVFTGVETREDHKAIGLIKTLEGVGYSVAYSTDFSKVITVSPEGLRKEYRNLWTAYKDIRGL